MFDAKFTWMVQKSTVPSAHRIRPSELIVNPRENVLAAPVLEAGKTNASNVRIVFKVRVASAVSRGPRQPGIKRHGPQM